MLHQGNFAGKKPSSGQRQVHKEQQRHSERVFLLHVPCGHNSSDCTQSVATWLPKHRGSPELPEILNSTFCLKNSEKRASSKDLLLLQALLGQGRGTTLLSARQITTLHSTLGALAGVSPVQRSSTSSHLLGKGLESPCPPGLGISSLRHLVSGVTQTHSNP